MNYPKPEFDTDLVRRLARNGPRYTSYPTADRFVEAFGDVAYMTWAARRNICNKIVTRDATKAARYLEYLGREIGLQGALFRDDPRVSQMHWGGGTPTYYDPRALGALFARLAGHFEFAARGEYSIEVDPRTVDAEAIHALREMGFNRVSFGVQDFDPNVQIAIHRLQSEEQTRAAVEAARRAGFESVNVDLIYGLP
ncbi:MAG: radical SAM protein, partial [Betaproteobacteria bacterium]|nr:radical SAM protein [Betaproteobacteria bacterium]